MDDETAALAASLATDLDRHFRAWSPLSGGAHRFALRLSNPQEAEDITQDALLRSYVALSHYPKPCSLPAPAPWLNKVTLDVFRMDGVAPFDLSKAPTTRWRRQTTRWRSDRYGSTGWSASSSLNAPSRAVVRSASRSLPGRLFRRL